MPKIAFLGSGNMAGAMVDGLLAKQSATPADLICLGGNDDTAAKLRARTGIAVAASLDELLREADTLLLAFKPQHLDSADPRLAELTAGKLVLSVLAGKKLATLAKTFPAARNLVRTMPNTPAAIGAGFTPYCSLAPLAATDTALVEELLGALGQYAALDEKYFDALTALGGSGPAFLFEYVAGMREAGIAAGLPPDVAYRVALETTLGAARLLARGDVAPEALRDKVTSPNGTTFAGLQVLAAKNFRDTLKETIAAATKRAGELSRD